MLGYYLYRLRLAAAHDEYGLNDVFRWMLAKSFSDLSWSYCRDAEIYTQGIKSFQAQISYEWTGIRWKKKPFWEVWAGTVQRRPWTISCVLKCCQLLKYSFNWSVLLLRGHQNYKYFQSTPLVALAEGTFMEPIDPRLFYWIWTNKYWMIKENLSVEDEWTFI